MKDSGMEESKKDEMIRKSMRAGRRALASVVVLCMALAPVACGKDEPEDSAVISSEADTSQKDENAGSGNTDAKDGDENTADTDGKTGDGNTDEKDTDEKTGAGNETDEPADPENDVNEGQQPEEEDKMPGEREQYANVLMQYKKIQEKGLTQEEVEKSGITTELIQHGWPLACSQDEVRFLFYDVDGNGSNELIITYYDDIVDIYAYNGEKVNYAFGNPYRGIAELYPGGVISETFSYSAASWYTMWYRFDAEFADFFPEFEMRCDDGKNTCYYEYFGVDNSREEVRECLAQSGEYPVWVYEWFCEDTKEDYEQLCPKEPPVRLPQGKKIADFNADEDIPE